MDLAVHSCRGRGTARDPRKNTRGLFRRSCVGGRGPRARGCGMAHGARVATPLLEREGRAVMLTGSVFDAERRPDSNRIVVANFTLLDIAAEATPKRLRIALPTAHGVPNVGERTRVRAVVRPAALPVMLDGFQFQRFLYFSGIGGVAMPLDAGNWMTPRRRGFSGTFSRLG